MMESFSNKEAAGVFYWRASRVTATTASSMPNRPPPFSWAAMRAPCTWRAPASPRSWVTSSCSWPRPVAPIGWPFDSRPPDGLIGMRPPTVKSPRSAAGPPSPNGTSISDSALRISPMAEASCTSATSTSDGATPAISYAFFAARWATILCGSSRLRELPVWTTLASTRMARAEAFFKRFRPSALHSTMAAAPSRIGDRRRGQHFFDAEGFLELGQRVVHRVLVVLGGDGGDLALRGAVALHVVAADGGVDVHEHAVGLVGHAARRRHDAFAHGQQRGLVLLDRRNVPAAVEGGEHLGLVGDVHLFGADGQRDVALAGAQRYRGQVEGRGAGGAGVFHRVDGDAFDAQAAHGDRAGDRGLALELAVGQRAVVGRAEVGLVAAGVVQRQADRFADQVVQAAFEQAAELGHADANDVDIFHGIPLSAQCSVWNAGRRACIGAGPAR